MDAPFRFGVALGYELTDDPVQEARWAERFGYDVVVMGDHIGPELSPMLTLAAVAQCTERIRLGTLVINADLRSPTQWRERRSRLITYRAAGSSSASAPGTPHRSTWPWAPNSGPPGSASRGCGNW